MNGIIINFCISMYYPFYSFVEFILPQYYFHSFGLKIFLINFYFSTRLTTTIPIIKASCNKPHTYSARTALLFSCISFSILLLFFTIVLISNFIIYSLVQIGNKNSYSWWFLLKISSQFTSFLQSFLFFYVNLNILQNRVS